MHWKIEEVDIKALKKLEIARSASRAAEHMYPPNMAVVTPPNTKINTLIQNKKITGEEFGPVEGSQGNLNYFYTCIS